MAKKKRPPRKAVCVPLSPAVIHSIGGLESLPPPDSEFDPDGTWTHVYRIWTCYGYDVGRTDGTLRLERTPDRLKVRQAMRNADNVLNTIEADVRCDGDRPVSWVLESTFTDTKGTPAPRLTQQSTVRQAAHGATSDWCLFSTVQRLPFEAREPLRFDVYEGLSLLKKGHRLWYHGAETVKLGSGSHRLHVFHQIGRGTLPYEYWVDEGHRLQVVVTGPRAYILDPKGGAK